MRNNLIKSNLIEIIGFNKLFEFFEFTCFRIKYYYDLLDVIREFKLKLFFTEMLRLIKMSSYKTFNIELLSIIKFEN